MKIKFTKMSGAGNDFIVINDDKFQPKPEIIRKLCDRHFGVGGDGVLLIQKSNSELSNFSVKYFNSDGSGDALCINGARCAILFSYLENIATRNCRFEFIGKLFEAEVIDEETVKIFLDYQPIYNLNKEIKWRSKNLKVTFFDIGSKHIIVDWDIFYSIYKNDLENFKFDNFDVNEFGKELRYHREFEPDGVNVNFVKWDDGLLNIRTYERGVENETLACGSGSICSAIYISITKNVKPPIVIKTRSQKFLYVSFEIKNEKFDNIQIIGPAEKIFEGVIEF